MRALPIARNGALIIRDDSIPDEDAAGAGLFQLAGSDRRQPPVDRLRHVTAGIRSSDEWLVRRAAVPPAAGCSQISRLPFPARSDAYASHRPSTERAGST